MTGLTMRVPGLDEWPADPDADPTVIPDLLDAIEAVWPTAAASLAETQVPGEIKEHQSL